MADTPPPSTPAPGEGDAERKRSLNNTAQANYITESNETLKAAVDPKNADIITVLAGAGYDAAGIAPGQALVAIAAEKFGLRLEGIRDMDDAQDDFATARTLARNAYVDFKTIARANYRQHSDRVALGLVGDVPDDFEVFVTTATASYTAGQKAPYTAKLTLRGYPVARLQALATDLDNLVEDEAAATRETSDAGVSTKERNQAYQALHDWMSEFKGTALGLFRRDKAARQKLKI